MLQLNTRTLVVRQGAWKSEAVLRPAMPPSTVSGKLTRTKRRSTIMMVPNGRAAVEEWPMATVFKKANTLSRGTVHGQQEGATVSDGPPGDSERLTKHVRGKAPAHIIMFHTQLVPFSWRYRRALTKLVHKGRERQRL